MRHVYRFSLVQLHSQMVGVTQHFTLGSMGKHCHKLFYIGRKLWKNMEIYHWSLSRDSQQINSLLRFQVLANFGSLFHVRLSTLISPSAEDQNQCSRSRSTQLGLAMSYHYKKHCRRCQPAYSASG